MLRHLEETGVSLMGASHPRRPGCPLLVSRAQSSQVQEVIVDLNGHKVGADLDGAAMDGRNDATHLLFRLKLKADAAWWGRGVVSRQPRP